MKTFDLTIMNQKFTIRSDADEKHVKKVADYVNKKMHEIVTGNKAISTSNVAILAALNIADDLHKIQSEKKDETRQWMGQIESILAHVEDIEKSLNAS